MIHQRIWGGVALALMALAPAAQTQYGNDRGEVVCESQDGRTSECRTPFRNPVISQQLSSSACVEGRTWGSRGPGNVWVTDGCRARFVEGGGYAQGGYGGGDRGQDTVRCESQDGRMRECPIPGGARVELARQLSDTRCVQGRNWGNRGNSIWVSDGCRADFAVAGGRGGFGSYGGGSGGGYDGRREGVVVCESQDRRDNSCSWNARWGRPQLVQQLSDDACREGYTWGYDNRANRIWVTRGCRAEFGRPGR